MSKYIVPDSNSLPDLEAATTRFWKDNNIFEKSIEQRPAENAYVFYDGPPFISGLPHYGHLLGSIAKDIVPRFWTMKGKRVERVWGWDAHGLTVENKVQKKLDIKNRREIEKFGLEKFTEECYTYTKEISAEWGWYIDSIGRWVDMDHAYKTIDQSYMESVMWAFKQLYEKGLIYEGLRTSLFCTTCGTPVSNFEVAMDNSYKDLEDPAITVKFPITTDGKYLGVYVLAWTTTPWTIPSNRALVLDDKAMYCVVECEGSQYIVAKPRVDAVFVDKQHKVVEEVLGAELVGLSYDPPFRFFASKEVEFKIYSFEGMANMEEGTGVVHSAPGFGDVDTKMGTHYGLTIMMTVDDEGKFVAGTAGENPWAGVYFSKANEPIREKLASRGLLFRDERITHRFPYHDRCNTNLIQKAQNSWFINIEKLRADLLKNNQDINWIPDHLKEGRFKIGIEQAPDWCISRNRFWATPMPVWEAYDGERIVIGSIEELEELSGQTVTDLHRPYIDKIKIKRDGKIFKRRPEVLDSWMEAGSMPYAQRHYPFENQESFEKNFPGDYIVEYVAQVRAWFYVMHVLSTALFGTKSFKNVISTGTLAGNDGRKMSKTYGNYLDPKEVLVKIGGDALRLYLMGSPLMLGEGTNFDVEELKTKVRNTLNPLWNSLKFFAMYATQYDWDDSKLVVSINSLDNWILGRLEETVKGLATNVEKYLMPPAVTFVEDFVDDLSKWYVRRSRDRIASGDNEALSTFYTVLMKFSKAVAPLIPFMSEEIYQCLREGSQQRTEESVHLCLYPEYVEVTEEQKTLFETMKNTRDIVSLALSIRVTGGIKVRQPLKTLYVEFKNGEAMEFVTELIQDEVNIKEVIVVVSDKISAEIAGMPNVENALMKIYLDTTLTAELKLEGSARELVRKIQDMRKELGLSIADLVNVTYPDDAETKEVIAKFGEEIKQKVMAKKLNVGKDLKVTI